MAIHNCSPLPDGMPLGDAGLLVYFYSDGNARLSGRPRDDMQQLYGTLWAMWSSQQTPASVGSSSSGVPLAGEATGSRLGPAAGSYSATLMVSNASSYETLRASWRLASDTSACIGCIGLTAVPMPTGTPSGADASSEYIDLYIGLSRRTETSRIEFVSGES